MTRRDESQSVLTPEKLFKTREVELPFLMGLSQVVHCTLRDTPVPFYTRTSPSPTLSLWRTKTDKEKSHKGIWRSECPGSVSGINSGRPRDTRDIWADFCGSSHSRGIRRTPRGSCNRTLLRRVLRRFFKGGAS